MNPLLFIGKTSNSIFRKVKKLHFYSRCFLFFSIFFSALCTQGQAPTITNLSPDICAGDVITITGTNFTGITAVKVKIGTTPVSSIVSFTSTKIIAVVGSACSGKVKVETASGTATSAATFTVNAIPEAPVVTTPVIYCQNTIADPLTASGSNLLWGDAPVVSSAGGSSTLTTVTWNDAAYSKKKTNFTTTVANVTIVSVDYYIPAWQSVTSLTLGLFDNSGTLLASSSLTKSLNNNTGSAVTVTNPFNYTITAPGNYSIGVLSGSGSIGGDSPSFPITEASGTITVTGANAEGLAPYHCFNNIQFTADNRTTTVTPSTLVSDTTTYHVSQTVNGCTSSQSTISVIVNPLPSATISYNGSPYCLNGGIASVTRTGTPGGTYSSISGLSVNSSTGDIDLTASAQGDYTVTYTIDATGGCSAYSTTANVKVTIPGTWTGAINNDWNNSGNWLCGAVPSSNTDLIISGGLSKYPILTSQIFSIHNITIQSGGSLTVSNGTLQIYGAIDNSGTFDASNGTIEMKGSSAQTIAGNMFYKKNIKNLIVSNTGSGLSVSSAANDTLKISGTLSFGDSNSTLNTGDNITLVSDSAGTANLGIVRPGNVINGKVIVERYINTGVLAGQHSKSWQFLSTPATGPSIKESWMENGDLVSTGYGIQITGPDGIASGFDAITATPSIKYYDPLLNSWVGVANADSPVYNPNGYMVFVRGDRSVTAYNQPSAKTTLRIKGSLLTGSLSPISVLPDKWKSIGNPYASSIDFSLITKGAGIDDKFYVWDPYLSGTYGLGGYQTLSDINNWIPVPGGTVSYTGTPCKIIQSGQAFFVHATSVEGDIPGAYDLTFTEDCKTNNNPSVSFARHTDILANRKQFFRTNLYTGIADSSRIADGNVVAFGENFNNEIDVNDAFKMPNSGENFGLKRNGKILSIEAKKIITMTDTIYFNMSNLKQQIYQLRFAPENMGTSGLEAFLIDQFLNTSTPVSLSDSSSVNITITKDPASAAADRFKMVFRKKNSISQDDKKESTAIMKAFINNDKSNNDKSFISVYPNPITDGTIHLLLKNQPEGTYEIRLLNSLGEKTISKKMIHVEGNETENIKWDYKLARGIYRLEITRPDGKIDTINVLY